MYLLTIPWGLELHWYFDGGDDDEQYYYGDGDYVDYNDYDNYVELGILTLRVITTTTLKSWSLIPAQQTKEVVCIELQ